MTPNPSPSSWRRRVRDDWTRAATAWRRWEPIQLYSLGAIDGVLLRALRLEPGQRVLDVGCGLGEPALSIAAWVAPGRVLGIDVSAPMIRFARKRSSLRRQGNVRFEVGDVAAFRSNAQFDRVVSRYGIMFVEDVPLALERIHASLVPGGRVAMAVWGPVRKNHSFRSAAEAMKPFLVDPAPDPERSPHPMRFARVQRLTKLLRNAGFREIRVKEAGAPLTFPSPAQYARMVLRTSTAARALGRRLRSGVRARVRAELQRRAVRYYDGYLVTFPGSAWVVSARR